MNSWRPTIFASWLRSANLWMLSEVGPPRVLEIGITGSAAIGGDMLSAAAASVTSTHRTHSTARRDGAARHLPITLARRRASANDWSCGVRINRFIDTLGGVERSVSQRLAYPTNFYYDQDLRDRASLRSRDRLLPVPYRTISRTAGRRVRPSGGRCFGPGSRRLWPWPLVR